MSPSTPQGLLALRIPAWSISSHLIRCLYQLEMMSCVSVQAHSFAHSLVAGSSSGGLSSHRRVAYCCSHHYSWPAALPVRGFVPVPALTALTTLRLRLPADSPVPQHSCSSFYQFRQPLLSSYLSAYQNLAIASRFKRTMNSSFYHVGPRPVWKPLPIDDT